MINQTNITESQSYLNSYLILHKCANLLESSEVASEITDYLHNEAERYFTLYLDVILEAKPAGLRKLFAVIFQDSEPLQ